MAEAVDTKEYPKMVYVNGNPGVIVQNRAEEDKLLAPVAPVAVPEPAPPEPVPPPKASKKVGK